MLDAEAARSAGSGLEVGIGVSESVSSLAGFFGSRHPANGEFYGVNRARYGLRARDRHSPGYMRDYMRRRRAKNR
jgi:hypothetical protein